MAQQPNRVAFVLAATGHGTMIVNRLDYKTSGGSTYGVGYSILETGRHAAEAIFQLRQLLTRRRAHFGDGVVALDCGANIGSYTVELARHMTGWGQVIAIEAQERVFYALAGNIALNNCYNARAICAAASSRCGTMRVPVPDYQASGSFGSLELERSADAEFIGQAIDYRDSATIPIPCLSIDSLELRRLDLFKIDVEGMEPGVLRGATATLEACRPIVVAEHIKSGLDALTTILHPLGYRIYQLPMDLIAIHQGDPTAQDIVLA